MTLPKDFELYTRNLMGEKLYEAFNQGLSEEAPTSIRINPFKVDADNIIIGNGNELVVIISAVVLRSPSTLCFILVSTMCRRHRRCSSTMSSARPSAQSL